jgi:hypothetical protein
VPEICETTMSVRGIDLELIETRRPAAAEPGLVVPNRVRINGTEVALPSDVSIQVGEITGNEIVSVTMTMAVRTLSIRSEVADV